MYEPATTLLFGLDKLDMLLSMYTDGFGPKHWSARQGDQLHSAHWILAHLALSLRNAAGVTEVFGALDKTFDFGAPGEESPADWPAPAALLAEFADAHVELARLWQARSQEEWMAPVKENRLNIRNKAQSAMFTLEHAVYHVGQLGALRRLIGLKGPV